MCHPDAPTDAIPPDVAVEEVLVPVGAGERMPGFLALPAELPAPAVVIGNDVVGRSPYYEHLAARFAEAGFVALDPEYFFRQGPLPELTLEHAGPRARHLHMPTTIDDLSHAADWLLAHPAVSGDRVGAVGFCMGGTFALVLTARRADIAAVCFYGFPQGSGQGEHASPVPLELVDAMHGPILGFFGEDDALVGVEPVERFARALADQGVTFDHTIYPNVGHGFMRHSAFDPEHEWYDAAVGSWFRTLDFLRAELTEGALSP